MAKFRKVDASVMKKPVKTATKGRPLSAEQQYLISKIRTITDDSVVFEVSLDANEKPLTVRQQLLRAAKVAGVSIAVRKSDSGFYVGLLTAERKSTRGRKPKSAS